MKRSLLPSPVSHHCPGSFVAHITDADQLKFAREHGHLSAKEFELLAGATSSCGELPGDFGGALEDTSIGGRRSVSLLAEN